MVQIEGEKERNGGEALDATSIIVAVLAFLGTLVGTIAGSKLTAYRIAQLEKKVDEHNNFARRVPVLEEQIKVANHRISDLEHMEH